MTRYLLLGLLLICTSQTRAMEQPRILHPYFNQLSVDDGLKSRWITSLEQDKHGFIWIGSTNGLMRYDSYHMTEFTGPNHLLEGVVIYDLLVDDSGTLWVASDLGAFHIDPNTLDGYPVSFEGETYLQTSANPVSQIKLDDQGTLWFARWNGIYYLPPGQTQARKLNISIADLDQSSDGIISLERIENHILIGTTRGLFLSNTSEEHLRRIVFAEDNQRGLNEQPINDVARIASSIWISSDKGVYKIPLNSIVNQAQQVFEPQLAHKGYSFTEHQDGYWLATNNGIYRVNKDGDHIEKLLNLNQGNLNNNNNTAYQLLFDNAGHLWIATAGSGIYQWSPRSQLIETYLHQATTSHRFGQESNIWSIKQAKGDIWVGTEGGLFRFSDDFLSKTKFNPLAESAAPTERAIYEIFDLGDRLWLGTYYGLIEFDTDTGETRSLPKKHKQLIERLTELNILVMYVDTNNILWIGHQNGLAQYSISNAKFVDGVVKTSGEDIFASSVRFIKQDNLGDYWIGATDGLYRWDVNNRTLNKTFQQNFKPADPLLSATDIYRENNNRLWVSFSGAGLYQLDVSQPKASVIQHYNSKNGMPDMTLYSIKAHQDYLWLSSHDGLLTLNRKSGNIHQLSPFNGVLEEEFNQGAHFQTSNGELLFGSVNGLFRIQPESFPYPESQPATLKLSRIQLLKPEVTEDIFSAQADTIELEPEALGLNIFVTDLSYFRHDTAFRYWLTGDLNIKPIITRQNIITLAGLPYGEYELHLETVGYDNNKSLSILIKLPPPPWLSTAAIISYAGILATLILGVFLFNRKFMKQGVDANLQVKRYRHLLNIALSSNEGSQWQLKVHKSECFYRREQFDEDWIPMSRHLDRIHPEDRSDFITAWQNLIQKKDALDITYRLKKPNESYQWYRDLSHGLIREQEQSQSTEGICFNIDKLKRLSGKAAVFSETFRATSDAILVINEQAEVLRANPAFFKLTNFNERQVLLKKIDIIHSSYMPVDFFQQLLDQVKSKGFWEGETWLVRSEQPEIPVYLKCGKIEFSNNESPEFYLAFSDISAIKEAEYKLRQLANYDPLTQLPNRTLFNDRIEHALERSSHLKSKLVVILVDLDHFKSINESIGHKSGDNILIEVATRIRHCLNNDDTLARIGGDEFVVLLENIESYDEISSTCQRLLEIIRQPFKIGQQQLHVSPSLGISVYPDDGRDPSTLLKNADIALNHAKSTGRNNFQYFTEEMNQLAQEQLAFELELRKAIASNELYPVFLPRFNIKDQCLAGFEVLLRWRKSTGQHVEPSQFIPIAEKLNLIIPLTEWLMDNVCQLIKENEQLIGKYEFSFNLSSNHFLNYDLAIAIKDCLRKYDVSYSSIELEITESTLMKNHEETIEMIRDLRALGAKITIDDFGTGYSSLTHLKNYPIDRLKIDHSFILGINVDTNSEGIIDTVIQLASNLSLDVVAEGIEQETQLDFLKQKNCRYAQGFLLSKPLMTEQMLAFIRSQKNL